MADPNPRRLRPMRTLVWALALGACLALAVALVLGKTETKSGLSGKITFVRYGSAAVAWDIYAMSADGKDQRSLTRGEWEEDYSPDWSPDGKRIVFQRSGDGQGIFIMSADGSGQRNLTNAEEAFSPAWSPDGLRIAFATGEIFVMNADGSDQIQLSNGGGREPAWSPDGMRIAFTRFKPSGGNYEIFVMNADGSGQTNLTNDPLPDSEPAWSPDGMRIAFVRTLGGRNNEIFVMNADGSGQRNLTKKATYADYSPAWSPDGTKIAFTSARTNDEIFVMNADGSDQVNLTKNPLNDFGPDWNAQPLGVARKLPLPKDRLNVVAPDWNPHPLVLLLRKCVVPRVIGLNLGRAKAKVGRAHCAVGRIRRARSREVGRVIGQSPRPAAIKRQRFPVKLVVGRR